MRRIHNPTRSPCSCSVSQANLQRRLLHQGADKTRDHIKRDKERAKMWRNPLRKVTPASTKVQFTKPDTSLSPSTPGDLELSKKFQELNVMLPLLKSLDELNWKEPTPIQGRTIPLAIKGKNIVASAETGTGKTAAYGLPLLHRLHIFLQRERGKFRSTGEGTRLAAPLALIMCPSRELVDQVTQHLTIFASHLPEISIMSLSGALRDTKGQINALMKGVDVLVATPGRLVTLLKNRDIVGIRPEHVQSKFTAKKEDEEEEEMEDEDTAISDENHLNGNKAEEKEIDKEVLDLSQIRMFVLDEVDRMLDMGHMPDIVTLFKALPKPRSFTRKGEDPMQVMMYSATIMPRILDLVKRFAPQNELIELNWDFHPASTIRHVVYEVTQIRKHALLSYLLWRRGSLKNKKVLVFCRSRKRVLHLTENLQNDKFKVDMIHNTQTALQRHDVIQRFTNGEFNVLVATEVMSRGIDIPNLDVVVNYDVPHLPEEYIHRVGRTGRAGKHGFAITFTAKDPITLTLAKRIVVADEKQYVSNIEKLLEKRLPHSKVPGPWRDEPKVKLPENRVRGVKRLPPLQDAAGERLAQLREKYKRISDSVSAELIHDDEDVHTQPTRRKKKKSHLTPREKLPLSVKGKGQKLSLRHFPESRYEDVLEHLQKKQAEKRGITLSGYEERTKKLEEIRQEKRTLKKAGLKPKKATAKKLSRTHKKPAPSAPKSFSSSEARKPPAHVPLKIRSRSFFSTSAAERKPEE